VLAVSVAYDAGPQSGGRPSAPGRLALVQAFVNSHFDLAGERGADLLATPGGLAAWLEGRGLRPGAPEASDVATALAFREGLRALLAGHNGGPGDPRARERLRDAAASGSGAAHAIADDGTTVPIPVAPGIGGAIGLLLAVVHEAQTAGTWPRLKACPGEHCGWAFYDTSRNGASRWCSMQVCGGREKARAYRRRASAAEASIA
jgi:predicted RNA-binding Zn ribbon-like protein